jgi:hypothetical protein
MGLFALLLRLDSQWFRAARTVEKWRCLDAWMMFPAVF